MRSRARIEEEIAALVAEAKEVLQRQGRALPEVRQWGDFLFEGLAMDSEGLNALSAEAEAAGKGDVWLFSTPVERMALPPAAEPLRRALLETLATALRNELREYLRARTALRPVLSDLLAQRAERWVHDWEASRMIGSAAQLAQRGQTPEEAARQHVSRLRGWEVVVGAGQALRAANREFWQHRWWRYGWGEYVRQGGEGEQRAGRGAPVTFEEEEYRSLLPSDEAAVVDALPYPQTDEEWPDVSIRAWLPRLRDWQAAQGVLGAVATTGEGADAQ